MPTWPGQRNGLIPYHLMAVVQASPERRLHPAASYWFRRMQADCRAATGAAFYIAAHQQTYRQKSDPYYQSQQDYWDRRQRNPREPAAAYPGNSNHGWALAADITFETARARAWYRANCHRYGWDNRGDDFGEDWHKEFVGSLQVPNDASTAGGIGSQIEENDMTPDQAYQLNHIYQTLTPGIENVKYDGVGYDHIKWSRSMSEDLMAAIGAAGAKAAKIPSSETLLGRIREFSDNFRQGITGVRSAGSLFLLLRQAAGAGDVDEAALAKALAPSLIPELVKALSGKGAATTEDVTKLRADLLAALSKTPADTLAAFGLKRA